MVEVEADTVLCITSTILEINLVDTTVTISTIIIEVETLTFVGAIP